MRMKDSRIITEPEAARSLLALLASLPPLDEDFLAIQELPYEPDLPVENWLRSEKDD